MATIQQAITENLSQYAIELSSVRLELLMVNHDLTGTDTYSKADGDKVKGALLDVVAGLLASPDITEGGMSLKWDRASVQTYCNQLKADLGLLTSSQPMISDRSNLW